jgi:hypothetical protein
MCSAHITRLWSGSDCSADQVKPLKARSCTPRQKRSSNALRLLAAQPLHAIQDDPAQSMCSAGCDKCRKKNVRQPRGVYYKRDPILYIHPLLQQPAHGELTEATGASNQHTSNTEYAFAGSRSRLWQSSLYAATCRTPTGNAGQHHMSQYNNTVITVNTDKDI